jgi:hypothetical protein
VNIVLVVDHSGSLKMSGSCEALIDAATSFVDKFASGKDKIGLVTFATTSYVSFPIANTFKTAIPNIPTLLHSLECAGSTSTAQALWTGYQQLVQLNQPEFTNVILFFTDGNPTGATFDMPIAASSPCTDYTPGSPDGPGGYSMPAEGKGYIRGVYNTYTNVSMWFGLMNPNATAGPNGSQPIVKGDLEFAAHSAGCAYASNQGSMVNTSDFLGVPMKDIYGNSANTKFKGVTLNSYGLIDLANNANAQAVAMNVAESAATNIRSGAVDSVSGQGLHNVVIYSIGLGNAPFPCSPEFLKRVSNDPQSPNYDPKTPPGQYIPAALGANLPAAFSAVASDIFRRAK